MLTDEQEKIFKWLLDQNTNIDSVISISNSMTKYPNNHDDKYMIKKLNELLDLNFISIKWYSPEHSSLDYAIDIRITPKGKIYFSEKKKSNRSNRREWVRTYMPSIISLIALLKSFDDEIIWLLKQLAQLLK